MNGKDFPREETVLEPVKHEISKSRDVPLWMDFDPTILSDKLLERRSGAQKTKK